jgi:hypothetical protein
MDVYHNNKNYEPERPSATWRDGIPDDPKELSEITENLNRAKAISVEQKVRKNNPDKSEDWIQKETARVETEIDEANNSAPQTI